MQQAVLKGRVQQPADDVVAALPLYAASLVVTLAGIGAVGVTLSSAGWTPVWVGLAVLGHVFSLALRQMRVSSEAIFYPVMLLGGAVTLQLSLAGSPVVGLDGPISQMPIDMATATLVGSLAA